MRAGAGSASLIEPRAAFMRYVGQGHEIVVPLPARDLVAGDAALLREAFQRNTRRCSHALFPMRRGRF